VGVNIVRGGQFPKRHRPTSTIPTYDLDSFTDNSIVYNKWHQTELERWLSDHDIPYPTPADRKDLENSVKDNWQSKVSTPYNDWSVDQLNAYLQQKGVQTKDAANANKDSLVSSVKNVWYETEDKSEDAWTSIKDWIFDR
jgi:hypothetical protein